MATEPPPIDPPSPTDEGSILEGSIPPSPSPSPKSLGSGVGTTVGVKLARAVPWFRCDGPRPRPCPCLPSNPGPLPFDEEAVGEGGWKKREGWGGGGGLWGVVSGGLQGG